MVFWQTAPPPHLAPRRHSLMSRQESPSPEICLDFLPGLNDYIDSGRGALVKVVKELIKIGKKGKRVTVKDF